MKAPLAQIRALRQALKKRLSDASPAAFSAFAVATAFGAYFCMYGLRKPFTAATYDGLSVFGLDLKTALVISQVIGYALSKFVSIKALSELPAQRRLWALLGLIAFSELALVGVGALPVSAKLFAIFLSGLPLGAVWGLVFGFLEGRRTSEILGAGLSASYIVSSGAVKTVGRWVLALGVDEFWMPAVTGLMFCLPFAICVWLLSCLPAPSAQDQASRTRRAPMARAQRSAFFLRFAPGLVTLTALYVLLTAYRDFRDNFAVELWSELGYGAVPAVLTYSELPVMFTVLIGLGSIFAIGDNRRAVFVIHIMMVSGTALIGLSTLLFDAGVAGGAWWMVLVGTGLYLSYVPFGCVLFDRLLAATGFVGTAVFMIYVCDAFGYAGSVALMLFRTFSHAQLNWIAFFRALSYAVAVLCSLSFLYSMAYFRRCLSERSLAPFG